MRESPITITLTVQLVLTIDPSEQPFVTLRQLASGHRARNIPGGASLLQPGGGAGALRPR